MDVILIAYLFPELPLTLVKEVSFVVEQLYRTVWH